ncbi:hypothetical protein CBA19CS11_32235 [Caballeronia novacaledonica]|uniref:YbjN domain-containing protein n=1 Tax=Caballeronia novacaledonica TaxID=1544861 RepID=UPI001EE1C3F9|nr:YbjN domain-containing protein [Caballeronia novacaledonica]GJH13607.1 hypothetical protein CBA19CS11_32235 [Caballeronia novacaledonica]
MKKIWNEDDISLDALAAHIADSGVGHDTNAARIILHTESGLAYQVTVDENKKFIRFTTYFPIALHASGKQKRELEHGLNSQVFMASFWIDGDNDLVVDYPLPFGRGLIAGNFMAVLHRFASILDFLIREKNDEGLILLGPNAVHASNDEEIDPDDKPVQMTEGASLLN